MYFLGIDIGSSFLKSSVLNLSDRRVEESEESEENEEKREKTASRKEREEKERIKRLQEEERRKGPTLWGKIWGKIEQVTEIKDKDY